MNQLIVVGGGGFAKEVVWLAKDCGFDVIGLLDDNESMHGKEVFGVPVVGNVVDWNSYINCQFVVAIGSPRTRKLVVDNMRSSGAPKFATLIHPTVIKSQSVVFSEGCIVCAGMIFTVDITIGEHCIFNLNGTVGHDCKIGSFVTVAPMAAISGNVNLHDFVEVGTGATLRQGVTLNRGSMLGMGAVLTKDIPDFVIYAGNPAKPLKELAPI